MKSPVKSPKVVLIGAGSLFFGAKTICAMATKPALREGTLVLVDVDAAKLKIMKQIADRVVEHLKVPLKVEASANWRRALRGADFVILAQARNGVRLRGLDSRISTRHGMIMSSGDTIGPGGTMRTLREVPLQNAILRDVQAICPDAWVINWVNPTAAMGIAMRRHFPRLRSMAICDNVHNPHFENDLIVRAGIAKAASEITAAVRKRVKFRSGGVNHFTWLLEMTLDGRDVTGRIKAALQAAATRRPGADHSGHGALSDRIAWQLADAFGYAPMCVGHTQEYLPYFQGHDVHKATALTISPWPESLRWGWIRKYRKAMKAYAAGSVPVTEFLKTTQNDYASDIIEAMWSGRPQRFYINTRNDGAVTNLTDDAYVEIACRPDMNGVHPMPFGPLPRPLLGFIQRLLDEHELAVEAAVTCDRGVLRRAFLASMVAVSIPDVDACIAEMLSKQREYLPAKWNIR